MRMIEDGSMDHNGNEEPLFLMRVLKWFHGSNRANHHKGVDDSVRSMDSKKPEDWCRTGRASLTAPWRRVDFFVKGKSTGCPQRIAKLVYS